MSDPKTPDAPANGNDELLDASLRHQIGVRRFTAGEVNRLLELMERADRDIARLLRERYRTDFSRARANALIRDIVALRTELMREIQETVTPNLLELSTMEADFENRMWVATLPVRVQFAVTNSARLRALVTEDFFSGGANAARTLQQWFDTVRLSDRRNITNALQLGILQSESVDTVVRRVVGTRAKGFTDGVLATSRRGATAMVRTAINHVSNAARETFWEANSDIIQFLRWLSTLDGRTSTICQGRDGKLVRISPGAVVPTGFSLLAPQTARPPAHPNCRSVMHAIVDSDALADSLPDRPFVRDARTRRLGEKNFRAEARENVGNAQWRRMSVAQRNTAIRDLRRSWADTNVGQVSGAVDYDTWLRTQSVSFQNEVLGIGKAKLFRDGLSLDRFVDRVGNELTLPQLLDLPI